MHRDPIQLTRDHYDVLVVGGGIHGLFAAYDAASRGFRTALVDRGDFGGAVSGNHQRTLHGGLRALQSGDLAKTRTQIRERRTWARIAPQLIRPLPFLFGTYRSLSRSRLAVRAGFAAYDLLARRRNDGVTQELHLPKGRLESAAATRRLFQGIRDAGLTGGGLWYDYQTTQAERLTWAVARAAWGAGAVLVNYVDVLGPGTSAGSVRARDVIASTEFNITANVVILAAAEGLSALHAAFGLPEAPPLLRAINLLLDRPAMDMALVAPSSRGQMLTAVPWRGYTLVGTGQSATPAAPGTRASTEEVAAFLADANSAFPRLQAGADDIRLVQQGLVPAVPTRRGLDLLPDFRVRRHAQTGSGPSALVSLIGAKYTTSRLAAERAVDAAAQALGRAGRRCQTAVTPLPHAGVADVEGQLIETARALGVRVPSETLKHLGNWYGTEGADVLRFAVASPMQVAPLSAATPMLAAEIAYARVHEMAVTPEDAIVRRTALGGTGRVATEDRDTAERIFVAAPTAAAP